MGQSAIHQALCKHLTLSKMLRGQELELCDLSKNQMLRGQELELCDVHKHHMHPGPHFWMYILAFVYFLNESKHYPVWGNIWGFDFNFFY